MPRHTKTVVFLDKGMVGNHLRVEKSNSGYAVTPMRTLTWYLRVLKVHRLATPLRGRNEELPLKEQVYTFGLYSYPNIETIASILIYRSPLKVFS